MGNPGKTEDTVLVSSLVTALAAIFLITTCFSTPMKLDSLELRASPVYRLTSDMHGLKGFVDIGLWGYCTNRSSSHSNFTIHASQADFIGCSSLSVGYQLDNNVANALGVPELERLVPPILTTLLCFYPMAGICTLVSWVLQILLCFSRPLKRRICGSFQAVNAIFFLTTFTTIMTLLALVVQIALITIISNLVQVVRKKDTTSSLEFDVDHSVWYSGFALFCHLINLSVIADWRKERRERLSEARLAQNDNKAPMSTVIEKKASRYFSDFQGKGLKVRSWSKASVL